MATLSQSDLVQFNGTEQSYRHWLFSLVYTDGIEYIDDVVGIRWFLDIISTEVIHLQAKEPFMVIECDVKNCKMSIKVTDGNDFILMKRDIEYTDFPEGTWKFYLQLTVLEGKQVSVLMLPSEY